MTTNNRTLLIGSLQVIMAGICWGTLGIFSIQLGKLGLDSFAITTLRIVTAGAMVLVLLPSLYRTLFIHAYQRVAQPDDTITHRRAWDDFVLFLCGESGGCEYGSGTTLYRTRV